MLQSLDTLIAFVVIVLVASLVVTILVQMLSSAFALRGKNLGNALALTFQSIHPDIGANAYALAERILSDPRLSDSLIPTKKVGEHTCPTQKGPWWLISPFNGLQLANAIRPNEIYDLLKKISAAAPGEKGDASTDPTPAKAKSDNAGKEVIENKKADVVDSAKSSKAPSEEELGSLAKTLIEKIGVSRSAVDTADKDLSALFALAGELAPEAEKANINNAIKTAQTSFKAITVHASGVDELTKWFTAAQDRAQQWFQMHTRIFTIFCGILLAFLLQLDAVEIFKFVSTNATARAALVASADKLVEKTDGVLEKSGNLLDRIYDTVRKQMPGIDLSKEARSAATNSAALKKAIQEDPAHKVPADFDAKYDKAKEEAIDAYYNDRRAQMDDLTKGVAATGFKLIPDKLGHRWDNEGGTASDRFLAHFLGMAITAGLLSLGAPYWYNLLKNLTSLRPAVSKLVGEEKAKKQPYADKPGKPPSTVLSPQ